MKRIIASVFLLLLILPAHTNWGKSPVLVGSDFLLPVFKDLETAWFEMKLKGSFPAMKDLESGEADLALLLQNPSDPPLGDTWVTIPFGYFGVSVVANEKNPINEISLDRLAGIFGSEEEFDFELWGDLGLSDWSDRGIKPVLLAGQLSIVGRVYQHLGLQSPIFKNSVAEVTSGKGMVDTIRNEEGSIGVMGLVPEGSPVKVLALAENRTATPLLPDEDTMHFSHYPLRLPIVMVVSREKQPELRQEIAFLLSEPVADALSEAGIFPLPSQVRERILIEVQMGR